MNDTKKIVLHLDAWLAGTDIAEGWIVSVNTGDDELSDFAHERAIQHAESYGIYPEYCREEDEYEGGDDYSDNIKGYWEDYDPEKHDGMLSYGSSISWNHW